jgi:hypothetical protein
MALPTEENALPKVPKFVEFFHFRARFASHSRAQVGRRYTPVEHVGRGGRQERQRSFVRCRGEAATEKGRYSPFSEPR